MNGKIALEEHFAIEPTLADSAALPVGDAWPELRARLLDIHDRRIREMDRHGIELMVLSLNAPAVQAVPDPWARATDWDGCTRVIQGGAPDVVAETHREPGDRRGGIQRSLADLLQLASGLEMLRSRVVVDRHACPLIQRQNAAYHDAACPL